jgi:hypothetical protein
MKESEVLKIESRSRSFCVPTPQPWEPDGRGLVCEVLLPSGTGEKEQLRSPGWSVLTKNGA